MTLYRPPDELDAGVSLESLLPEGPSRRLDDNDLSIVVQRIAMGTVPRRGKEFRAETAQDLALEVLVRRSEDGSFLSTFEEIIPWVVRGMDLGALKERRRNESLDAHESDVGAALHPDHGQDVATRMEGRELLGVLNRTIAGMTVPRRQALMLTKGDGHSRKKAAQIAGKSENTLKNQLADAMKELGEVRRAYDESGKGPKEPTR